MTRHGSGLLGATTSLVAGLVVLTGCATSTTGSGSATEGPLPSSQPPSPTLPTSVGTPTSPAPGPSTQPAPPSSQSTPPGTPVTVTGLISGTTYHAQLYATSKVTDCAAHSYGPPMISYFQAHPCRSATRRLFTIDYHGRTVVMSAVAVIAAPGPGNDYYKWAGKLEQLENADSTGSVNDLLREGYRIPGAQSAIPADEAFDASGQDDVVTVTDAWYEDGSTRNQDPGLVRLEKDLFLTPLTTP